MPKKTTLLYEGKAKKVFETDDPNYLIVSYKDDATAFNGEKKGTILGKGAVNNQMTNRMLMLLETQGVPTHFMEELSPTETLVKRVTIMPIEVILRNRAAGSICKRLGLTEGIFFDRPIIEFSYKNDALGDPLFNDDHIRAMKLATDHELNLIRAMTLKINSAMIDFFAKLNINLIDFKLEFGKDNNGNIMLADEISPDTCRFWDKTTNQKLDKDRFRLDLGGVEEAYEEVFRRLTN